MAMILPSDSKRSCASTRFPYRLSDRLSSRAFTIWRWFRMISLFMTSFVEWSNGTNYIDFDGFSHIFFQISLWLHQPDVASLNDFPQQNKGVLYRDASAGAPPAAHSAEMTWSYWCVSRREWMGLGGAGIVIFIVMGLDHSLIPYDLKHQQE